jgi:hypothetical protein
MNAEDARPFLERVRAVGADAGWADTNGSLPFDRVWAAFRRLTELHAAHSAACIHVPLNWRAGFDEETGQPDPPCAEDDVDERIAAAVEPRLERILQRARRRGSRTVWVWIRWHAATVQGLYTPEPPEEPPRDEAHSLMLLAADGYDDRRWTARHWDRGRVPRCASASTKPAPCPYRWGSS